MSDELLSTTEVAKYLKVNVSTIKRWANAEKLICFKTIGKHRKYRLKDVIDFAEKNSFDVSPVVTGYAKNNEKFNEISFAVYSKDVKKLSEILYNLLIKGDRDMVTRFFKFIYTGKIDLVTIIDDIIFPAQHKLGELWKKKKIGVDTEHIATFTNMQSFIKLQDIVNKKSPNGLVSVAGCFEGEFHSFGIVAISSLLEAEGWTNYVIGDNTPAISFINTIKNYKPALVCISATYISDEKSFIRDCKRLVLASHKAGTKITLGGSPEKLEKFKNIKFDGFIKNAKDFMKFISENF